jgi:hypothetical protein
MLRDFYAKALVSAGVKHFSEINRPPFGPKTLEMKQLEYETMGDKALYSAIIKIDTLTPRERVLEFRRLYDSMAVTPAQRDDGHMTALAGIDQLIANNVGELAAAVETLWNEKRNRYITALRRNLAFPFGIDTP